METIRSIVEAFAKGQIKLDRGDFDPQRLHEVRIAPNFSRGGAHRPEEIQDKQWYTVVSLGRFLGKTNKRTNGEERAADNIEHALAALQDYRAEILIGQPTRARTRRKISELKTWLSGRSHAPGPAS